jgi:selenocysteine lyase/cysteine desulfurase
VSDPVPAAQAPGIGDARRLFPATAGRSYFNTAAVGLASGRLAETYRAFIDEWAADGLDYSRGERAAGEARSAVAALIGADTADIALIPSVSSAAVARAVAACRLLAPDCVPRPDPAQAIFLSR